GGGAVGQQRVFFTGVPTGGTFTLSIGSVNTGSIAYSTTAGTLASNVQSALNASGVLGANAVTVTSPVQNEVDITFNGTTAINIPFLTVNSNNLSGGSSPALFVVAPSEIQRLTFASSPSGNFTLVSPTGATTSVAYNSNTTTLLANVQGALNTLFNNNTVFAT